MEDTWLSCKIVARVAGEAERTVQRKAANREYVTRQQRLGRRGRPQLQLGLSSLKADAQLEYARLQLKAAEAGALVPADPAQSNLFASPVEIDMRAWSGIPEAQREEAKRRLRVITPLIHWNAGHRPAYALRDDRPVLTTDDLARYLGEQHATSARSIWRWYVAFAGSKKHPAQGVMGLRDIRSDAKPKRSRYFETHAEAAKFVLAKYKELGQCSPTGSPNLMKVYDELEREYPRMYPGEKRPSPQTIRNFIGSLPPVWKDAARLTRQKHDAKYAPYVITRGAKEVNDIWVCDHRVLDILSFNDCFALAPRWHALRVWVTAIEDMHSRVVWGVCTDSPSWRSIASALRLGMSRFGKPRVFYCDNGLDFKKVGGGSWAREPQGLNDEGQVQAGPITENLLQRLAIRAQYCIPRHPQSKSIESFFSTMSKQFDVMFGAGYAGSKPSLRPDRCREAEQKHHLWLQDKTDETPFLPASHVIGLLHAWIEEYNAFHDHTGYGMDGRAPYDVMNQAALAPVDVAAIEQLFWAHQARIVSNCTVQINKQSYVGVSDHDAAAMYGANGTEIVIAYDPDNLDRALAVADGVVIARLHRQERVDRGLPGERSPATEAEIGRVQRMGRANYKAAMRFWQFATEGVPTMLDGLRQRAGLAMPAPVPQPAPQLRAASAQALKAEPEFIDDLADRFAGGN